MRPWPRAPCGKLHAHRPGDTSISPVWRAVIPGPSRAGGGVSVRTPRPSGVTPGAWALGSHCSSRRSHFPGADRGDPPPSCTPAGDVCASAQGCCAPCWGPGPGTPSPASAKAQGPGPWVGAGLQPLPQHWEPRGEWWECRPGGLGAAEPGSGICRGIWEAQETEQRAKPASGPRADPGGGGRVRRRMGRRIFSGAEPHAGRVWFHSRGHQRWPRPGPGGTPGVVATARAPGASPPRTAFRSPCV